MKQKTARSAATFVMAVGLIMALSAPAAAATNHILGVGYLDTAGDCGDPPAGYAGYGDFTLVMTGDLEGCWYTDIVTAIDHGSPSGIYQERGKEIFVGSLDGGPVGTFTTTYKFNSKWDPRCVHRLGGPWELPAPDRRGQRHRRLRGRHGPGRLQGRCRHRRLPVPRPHQPPVTYLGTDRVP